MTDSGNKQRPLRKLTVDNFSVIKHAELEFGKITVLIGPQASGKSLLCKLAYFLSKEVLEDALIAIVSQSPSFPTPFDEFKTSLRRDFLAWFPFETWQIEDSRVTFESLAYRVQISATKPSGDLEIVFSPEFEALFSRLAEMFRTPASGAEPRRLITEQVRAQLYLLLAGTFVDRPVYIPDGRAFFANQSLGFNLVNNPDIDPILKEFSLEVSWAGARSPDPILGEEGVRVLYEVSREIVRIAGGRIEGRNGSARFIRTLDGKSIPLPLLSSGTQAMLPMLNVLWQMITEQRGRILFPRPDNLPGMPNKIIESKGLVYLEEPEANIFPSTQYELIRLFAWLSQEWRLDFSWVITTHSPYTLSSFNNLIYAGQLASQRPELKDEIARMVPERYWIEDGSFRAYSIHDGLLKPILSESGLIDGEYLDCVSDTIGNEFDSLLRLEYDHTKAS
jgi:energy-coupling factor transporter ATP-binding protein EcfA2